MKRTFSILFLFVVAFASLVHASSLEKAKTLYQNGLLDDAKRELIDIIYDSSADSRSRATATYMLGLIALRQGNSNLAKETWTRLVKSYPDAPETALARQSIADLNGPAKSLRELPPNRLRLLTVGEQPRVLLEIPASKSESMRFVVGMTIADRACPKEPGKLAGFPTAAAEARLRFTIAPDEDSRLYRLQMGGQLAVVTSDRNGARKVGAPEMIAWSSLLTKQGFTVETTGTPEIKGNSQVLQYSQYPAVPVGLGATWEIPIESVVDGGKLEGTATAVIRAVEEAAIHIDLTGVVTGDLSSDGRAVHASGTLAGHSVWRKGSFGTTTMEGLVDLTAKGAKRGCMEMSFQVRPDDANP